jgi:hypothetical protein
MSWSLWYLLLAVLIAMIVPGLWDKQQRLQFPFLLAVASLYHVALPLFALLQHPESSPVPDLWRVILMALLCLGAAWGGYQWRWQGRLFDRWRFDERKLILGAGVLVTVGLLSAFGVGQIEIQTTEEGQMTGLATILVFLGTLSRFGFAMAGLLLIRTRKKWLWLLLLPQLWIYYGQLTVARRTPMGELAVSVLLLVFFWKRWTPPVWLITLMALVGAFYHFNVTTLRATIGQPLGERIQVLMASNPFDAFKKSGLEEKEGFSVELANAGHYMSGVTRTGDYTYGRHFWNQLVFGWVPAQFVGREFKESLKFELPDQALQIGYEKPFGTCETGIAEAYMAFWFFGALLFFAMGAGLRLLWDHAQTGSLIHQTLLILCTFGACMTFSGQLWSYINYVSQILVFTVPFFWWGRIAEVRPGTKRRTPRSRASRTGAVPPMTN